MTTATLEMSTPVDVLNHKKRFAAVLDAKADSRFNLDKIKAAPRAAREGLASLFRTLHVDALAGSIGATVSRLWGAGWERIAWLRSFIGRTLGWRTLSLYILTDDDARSQLGNVLGGGYLAGMAVTHRLRGLISRIPLLGKPFIALTEPVLRAADTVVMASAGFVVEQIDRVKHHWTVRYAAETTRGLMFYRLVKALVPAPYRFGFYLAYLFKPAKRAYQVVRDDEATAKIGEQVNRVKGTARAAAAESADIVVDRIMDGPDTPKVVYTTQPGTEALDIIVVATGKRETVTVDVDSRGQKWITWDGVTYAAEEIGQGENDPIRPLPIDVVTKAMKIEAEANKAAAAAGTPPLSRAVARATGGTPARARSGGKAKAGSGRR